tara:strand:- start:184 stop:504 length:321 start_codon:yes stop_codon:yes gene_type:complete
MSERRIGLSLSFCIKAIIAGEAQEGLVDKIISSTRCASEEDWAELLKTYRDVYWRKSPDEGEAVFRRFLRAGKIEQPRLNNNEGHNISGGIWIDSPAVAPTTSEGG